MPHEVEALSSIRAAPPATTAAFDLAESLSTQALPNGPWRHAFRQLITDEAFLAHGWAKAPFKLAEEWPFAVGSYTMEDVARDATLMPPQFLAHGVEYEGGIYNKPFAEGFGFADVEAAMVGPPTPLRTPTPIPHIPHAYPHIPTRTNACRSELLTNLHRPLLGPPPAHLPSPTLPSLAYLHSGRCDGRDAQRRLPHFLTYLLAYLLRTVRRS